MTSGRRVLASLILAVALWGAWQWWFDPRRVIARRLDGLAETLSAPPGGGGVERVARAARLAGYFAPQVQIAFDRNGPSVTSREALLGAVASWGRSASGWDVEVVDLEVAMESSTTARAHMTVQVTGTDQRAGDRSFDAREVAAGLAEADGVWVITSARLVETLQQP